MEISEDCEKPEFDLTNVNIANYDVLVQPTEEFGQKGRQKKSVYV